MKERIESELKQAMKSGDALRLSVLRLLAAAVHNREIEKRSKLGLEAPASLDDGEMVQVIRSELKKRRDAIAAWRQAGREAEASQEEAEAAMLAPFLPQELGDAEIADLVQEGTQTLGVTSQRDFGKLMGWVMGRVAGRASGERVLEAVKRRLGGA